LAESVTLAVAVWKERESQEDGSRLLTDNNTSDMGSINQQDIQSLGCFEICRVYYLSLATRAAIEPIFYFSFEGMAKH